jgi:hypothetical protein
MYTRWDNFSTQDMEAVVGKVKDHKWHHALRGERVENFVTYYKWGIWNNMIS